MKIQFTEVPHKVYESGEFYMVAIMVSPTFFVKVNVFRKPTIGRIIKGNPDNIQLSVTISNVLSDAPILQKFYLENDGAGELNSLKEVRQWLGNFEDVQDFVGYILSDAKPLMTTVEFEDADARLKDEIVLLSLQ